ncbi:hypothetical protein GCM10027048_28150 [Hymenobacter coalescens]
MPTAYRTLRFFHNAMQEVAQKHGLAVHMSHEWIEADGTMRRSSTVRLPNGVVVGPPQFYTPDQLDKFLTLMMPAFAGQSFKLDPVTGVTMGA